MDLGKISPIRDTRQELAENQQETQTAESAHQVETILLRMLDEYDSGKRTEDVERMELVQPTSEDFTLVCGPSSRLNCVYDMRNLLRTVL